MSVIPQAISEQIDQHMAALADAYHALTLPDHPGTNACLRDLDDLINKAPSMGYGYSLDYRVSKVRDRITMLPADVDADQFRKALSLAVQLAHTSLGRNDLLDLSGTGYSRDKGSIDYIEESVRKYLKLGGLDPAVLTALEPVINEAKRKAHLIAGDTDLASFEKNTVPYSASSIKHITERIREHYALGGKDATFMQELDVKLADFTLRAHQISGDAELAAFEKNTVPHMASSIKHIAKRIHEHYTLAGKDTEFMSALGLRLADATRRSHLVSAERDLEEFEKTTVEHGRSTVRFIAQRIRDHFKEAGVKVKEEGAFSLGIQPDAKLGKRIDKAKERAMKLSKSEY